MADKDWKAERRKGIGGSDAAAILGLSPWKNAMDVWLEKMNLATEVTDPAHTFLLELGQELEPVVARLYEKRTGRTLYAPANAYVHPMYSALRGNPDRLVQGETRGVELKTETVYSDKFGEPGTDEVPFHYLVQCAHYMMLLDYPAWDIALLKNGTTFSIYTIERDMELERDMAEQLTAWWVKHVVGKVPPDVDGSGAWKAYLRKRFPSDILPVLDADKNVLSVISSLQVVRQILSKYEGVKDALENRVKMVIGPHQGIEGSFGKITWKKSKDTTSVNWEAAFRYLGEDTSTTAEEMEAIINAKSTHRAGSRRFLLHVKEGWMYGDRQIEASDIPRLASEVQNGDRAGAPETLERGSDVPDRAHVLPAKSEARKV
jgi:putative phage-type endonuclease